MFHKGLLWKGIDDHSVRITRLLAVLVIFKRRRWDRLGPCMRCAHLVNLCPRPFSPSRTVLLEAAKEQPGAVKDINQAALPRLIGPQGNKLLTSLTHRASPCLFCEQPRHHSALPASNPVQLGCSKIRYTAGSEAGSLILSACPRHRGAHTRPLWTGLNKGRAALALKRSRTHRARAGAFKTDASLGFRDLSSHRTSSGRERARVRYIGTSEPLNPKAILLKSRPCAYCQP